LSKLYETVVIIDAMIPDEAIESEFDAITDKINKKSELKKLVRWGRKKLAYPINGRTHGEYGIFYYESDGEIPRELESGFRINENILRWLTIAEFPGGVPEDKPDKDAIEEEKPVKKEMEPST